MPEIDVISNETEAIFYNDWVACLCAHYLYCQEQGDAANALGLRRVLVEAGVSDAYIDSLVLPTPLPAESEAAVSTELAETAEAPLNVESNAPPPVEALISPGSAADLLPAEMPPAVPVLPDLEPTNTVIDASPERPLDLPLTLDLILPGPIIETDEIAPATAPLEPGPDLTPDYPSSGKPKRGKRTPPPQPTLF